MRINMTIKGGFRHLCTVNMLCPNPGVVLVSSDHDFNCWIISAAAEQWHRDLY